MAADEWTARAVENLERVKELVSAEGLRHLDIDSRPMGIGIGVAWSETRFVVLSVPFPPNHDQLYITCGVLRDVVQDRVRVIEACHARIQQNAAYPFYLHDGSMSWDVIVQTPFPVRVMLELPPFFASSIRGLPAEAERAREEFAGLGLGGVPFRWNADDVERLLGCAHV